ncbi:Aldehyde dehydrogenase, thermostable [Pigmentiphaga humi]|uniref:Aldehyde dehydrogenase, thermostable n=1 Tax=Pigmentiphaga humi TaxID=2478468 RepID=A0A3P4B5V5_9BURK|nr:aldehyde dehydrogenase family protein [Pigmentiphaga humi]VCU71442.1 Aldehyde dehydrogenase, thermostable [Pigmentiphaga humi]
MELQYRIGAEWAPGEHGDWAEDTSPSDVREVLARYRLMSRSQVDRAMDAAIEAFPGWKAASPVARAAVLSKAAALLRQRRDEHARVVARENGKTLAEATVEVEKSADFLDFYAATARMPSGGLIADARPGTRGLAMTEPVGVIAMITPWNDPMLTPARKLGPALVSGCTVVLKPARETPLAADLLVRALVEAGLPAGVLNTVIADHATFDAAVIAHPRLAGVTFTGSTAVGLGLSRKLAGRTVRLQTEMGGKNATVVLADADLDLAASTLAAAAFGQAGQRCTATSRVIVEETVHDALLERLRAAAGALRLGASLDPGTQLGPVVSRRQQAEVLAHIDKARAHGGRIELGGGQPDGEAYAHGCFVQPTIVTGVTADMPLWREEVFGPVLAIRRVASFDEAVAAVNDSDYGLSAALFTSSLRHAQRFLDAADTGQVGINLPTSGWDVHQPFGGFKESGSPFKEQGVEGLRFYTRTKMAAIRFDW